MKRFLIPLLAALALPSPLSAGVNREIHKICKEARDYSGCIEAQQEINKNPLKKKVQKINFYNESTDIAAVAIHTSMLCLVEEGRYWREDSRIFAHEAT